jgi:predicted Rossmann-fold nucleotide-binding protein
MRSICVFCGSKPAAIRPIGNGQGPGRILAREGLTMVYGGASVGLRRRGHGLPVRRRPVVGVLPDFLERKELAHTG